MFTLFGLTKEITEEEIRELQSLIIEKEEHQGDGKLLFTSVKDNEKIEELILEIDSRGCLCKIIVNNKSVDNSNAQKILLLARNELIRLYAKTNPDKIGIKKLSNEQVLSKLENKELVISFEETIKESFNTEIADIELKLKAKDANSVQLTTSYIFTKHDEEENKEINTDSNKNEKEPLSIEDLEDEGKTVYENEDNYSAENEENTISTEIKEQQSVNENCIENKCKEKKFKKIWSLLKEIYPYIICSVFFLFIWILFLKAPIEKMTDDLKQNIVTNNAINIVYYAVYFVYTVLSCVIPGIIKKAFCNFQNEKENGKRSLTETNIVLSKKNEAIWRAYKSTFFNKDFGIQNKTRASADLYFNYDSVIGTLCKNPVISWFKIIASSFMGLGILGTFIGFSIGLSNINFQTESTTEMMKGIEALVKNGLATAFNTSIVGVLFSLIYNFFIYNPLIKKMFDYFEELSDELDEKFYVSETEALMEYTMVTDENSENIPFSQSLRFIVENMNKQTDALNNFNNNLADKISNMKQSVDTAMERMAADVGGELKNVVVENVKSEMGGLKQSLIETAKQFTLAAEKLQNTPELIEKANSELKTYLEDTRTSFVEMLSENEKSNKLILDEVVVTVKEQLADQFERFSDSLSKALNDTQNAAKILSNTPEVLEQIENTLLEKEENVAEKFEKASDKLTGISTNITEYLSTMQEGIASILDDLSNAEENVKELLASAKINEDATGRNLNSVIEETNTMLAGFKAVDINLKNIFESIGNEIQKYNASVESTLDQYLEAFEKGSSSFSTSITGSMEEFETTIDSLNTNMIEIQKSSKQFETTIDKLSKMIVKKN